MTPIIVFLYMLIMSPDGEPLIAQYREPFTSLEACEEAAPMKFMELNSKLRSVGAHGVEYQCIIEGKGA